MESYVEMDKLIREWESYVEMKYVRFLKGGAVIKGAIFLVIGHI